MAKSTRELVTELLEDDSHDLVRYLGSRLPNNEDAKDLAQEAYLRLLRLEQVDLIRNPEAYLFRIATNLINEYWLSEKKTSSKQLGEFDFDSQPSEQTSTEILAEQHQALGELSRVLNFLPPLHKQVVLMHRRDGMTYAEIAQQLEISPHMVKKHLIKGLVRCQEYLRRHHHG